MSSIRIKQKFVIFRISKWRCTKRYLSFLFFSGSLYKNLNGSVVPVTKLCFNYYRPAKLNQICPNTKFPLVSKEISPCKKRNIYHHPPQWCIPSFLPSLFHLCFCQEPKPSKCSSMTNATDPLLWHFWGLVMRIIFSVTWVTLFKSLFYSSSFLLLKWSSF